MVRLSYFIIILIIVLFYIIALSSCRIAFVIGRTLFDFILYGPSESINQILNASFKDVIEDVTSVTSAGWVGSENGP